MAIYALRNTASLEVLSIVEYDGSSSYEYLAELGLELYSGSMIEEFTAQEHTPYDLYDPIHGLHITSEVGSVLKGFNFITGSVNLVGDIFATGSSYWEGDTTLLGSFSMSGSLMNLGQSQLTGSFFGAFEGILDGTASNAVYALTASFAQNASSIEVITKSKNWIKPSWAKTVRVTCVGGGGGGGAAPALEDTVSLTIGAGGGGGGTITVGEFDANTLPDTISITVGAGGIGGTHDGINVIGASNGGDSTFGRYLLARGGNAGFNGGIDTNFAYGGSTIANIHYLNTGAGGGGAGTVDGFIGSPLSINDASEAPSLPLPNKYIGINYYIVTPTPIPAVIAPTGGGGGLGYDFQNGGRQDGVTNGGIISAYGLTNQDNRFQSLSPFEYGSGSYEMFGGELIDLEHYPAYNTTVGLGGRGGNPYYIDTDLSTAMPTDGTIYGGGGGGAFGGGIDGRYTNGQINGTPYNFGANGAQGVVVIISEA